MTAVIMRFWLAPILLGPPIIALFNDRLASLPAGPKWLLITICVGILLGGTVFLIEFWKGLPHPKKWATASAAVLAVALFSQNSDLFPGPDDVLIRYSDGALSAPQPGNTVPFWGRRYQTWLLHPRYAERTTPEMLEARFSGSTSRIRICASKPPHALLTADGASTNSDGVSLEVVALDRNKKIIAEKALTISQEDFLQRLWICTNMSAAAGIPQLTIRVTTGPPGSTPYHDGTLVSLQSRGMLAYLAAFGDLTLRALSVMVIVLAVLAMGSCRMVWRKKPSKGRLVGITYRAAPILFITLLVGIAYWHATQSHAIYSWDLRNYWEKTELLVDRMEAGEWSETFSLIASSYSLEYSMIPAILPALASLVVGEPTQVRFAVLVVVFYAAPAFLMISYIGWRCFGTITGTPAEVAGKVSLAALGPLLAMPVFFAGALYLRPDIGGVALMGAAMLVTVRLSTTIASQDARETIWSPGPRVVGGALLLSVLLAGLFVFRRWYIFGAVGIGLGLLGLIGYEVWRARSDRARVVARAAVSGVIIGTGMLALLCWVLFAWAKDPQSHDYVDLYSAYRRPALLTVELAVGALGVVAPLTALVAIAMRIRTRGGKRLLLLLCGVTFIAGVLFLQVSTPGLHHYYLLMPLLGVGIVGATLGMIRWSRWVAFSTFFCIVALGFAVPRNAGYGAVSEHRLLAYLTPGYQMWLPRRQPGEGALTSLGNWLVSKDMESKRICVVASSLKFNTGIVQELWQIVPTMQRSALADRFIALGDVDSVDGPPWPALKRCDLVLVGEPPQIHLPGQQFRVLVTASELLRGDGIGAAFERLPAEFVLDEQTKIIPFLRNREITDDEFKELLRRVEGERRAEAKETPDG